MDPGRIFLVALKLFPWVLSCLSGSQLFPVFSSHTLIQPTLALTLKPKYLLSHFSQVLPFNHLTLLNVSYVCHI